MAFILDDFLIQMAIAAAATAAGSGMQSAAQRERDNEFASLSTALVNAETDRQKRFESEMTEFSDHSQEINKRKNIDALAAIEGQKAENSLLDALSPASSLDVAGANAPRIVHDEADRQFARADAVSRQNAGAMSQMRGLDDAFFKTGLDVARDSGRIGQLGRFSQRSSALMPNEISAAKLQADKKGKLLDMLGGLAQTAGMMYGVGSALDAGKLAAAGKGAKVVAPYKSAVPTKFNPFTGTAAGPFPNAFKRPFDVLDFYR